jgi:hypothetical protein
VPAAAAVVVGVERGDRHGADPSGLSRRQLGDGGKAQSVEERTRPRRHQQRRPAVEPAQRADVGVVAVQVGDQHRVEPLDHRGPRRGGVADERPDPLSQHRVGQQAGALDVDQDGSMADVVERV